MHEHASKIQDPKLSSKLLEATIIDLKDEIMLHV